MRVIFEEDAAELIKTLMPDVLVRRDWKPEQIMRSAEVLANGDAGV
ncbi:MAG: hypothetical protein R2792_05370 [Saprospiraceae bacterium]